MPIDLFADTPVDLFAAPAARGSALGEEPPVRGAPAGNMERPPVRISPADEDRARRLMAFEPGLEYAKVGPFDPKRTIGGDLLGLASGVAQVGTGAAEMLPNKLGGGKAAEATKFLQQYGNPETQATGRILPFMVPVGAAATGGKILTSIGLGALGGAATPTGETDEVARYKDKALNALISGGVGGGGALAVKSVNYLADTLKGAKSKAEIDKLMNDFYSGKTEESLFPGRVMSPDDLKNLQNEAKSAPASDVTGKSMLDRVDAYIQGLRDQRRTVGETTYGAADTSMAAKHDAGDFWQESPSGQKFISSLEDQISTATETKETTGVRNELQRLIRDLRGESIPQVESQVLDALGNPIETAAAANAYSRPEVLREVLRKLRDAGKGYPEEGYAAIEQGRAKELADGLAKSISGWDENLMLADMKYRDASKLLYPGQTKRGKAALAGEKFDRAELAADPASVPNRFFNSKQGVQQLTDLVGGDKQFVESAATEHTMRSISEMTPDNAAKFLRENKGWLNYEMLPQTMAKAAQYIHQRQYEPMVAPIKEMLNKYEKGLISPTELPAAVRTILANKSTSVEASREIAQQLAKIEQIQSKEKQAQGLVTALKKVFLLTTGVAIGGPIVGRPLLNRLAPESRNYLPEQIGD
jgi:hypothetical protein